MLPGKRTRFSRSSASASWVMCFTGKYSLRGSLPTLPEDGEGLEYRSLPRLRGRLVGEPQTRHLPNSRHLRPEHTDRPGDIVPEGGVALELQLVADRHGGSRPEDRHDRDIVAGEPEHLLQRLGADFRIAFLVRGVERLI